MPIIDTLIRCFLAFVLRTGLYGAWSRFWRDWEVDRMGDFPPIERANTLDELAERMRGMAKLWTPDPWWVGGDFWSYPQKLEHARALGVAVDAVDCDEFATYCCEALSELVTWHGVRVLGVLQVVWRKPGSRKYKGHHVCLYQHERDGEGTKAGMYGHIGNWGRFEGFRSRAHAARHVAMGGTIVTSWLCRDWRNVSKWKRVDA